MTVTIRPNSRTTGAAGPTLRRTLTALTLVLTPLAPVLGPVLVPATAVAVLHPQAAAAQSFSPVIRVNDEVITAYELDQRTRLLSVLGGTGDPAELAREQLIDDRLKLAAARSAGINPGPDEVEAGMAEFAGRGGMGTEEFVAALAQAGVARETFRDFVTAGTAWRQVVQGRFGSKVQISEDEVDRAIETQSRPGGVSVLLSEIFIPLQPDPARAEALAQQISQISTTGAFSEAAAQYSAAPTRTLGGRVDWMDLSTLPGPLQSTLMSMAPGDVTAPLPVEGAFALFQLRAIQETGAPQVTYSAVDYAMYYVDGANTEAGLKRMAQVTQEVDTCDDLYGVAHGQPPAVLDRQTVPTGQVPRDVALELAKLDKDEVSTNLRRNGGQTGVVLMLCGRVPSGAPSADEIDRAQIVSGLQNRRLASYADGYLAQLRSEARILE
ncbi:peptidylprolyl isomerase [Pseudooceanicola sp. HF7]|uniref:peptidylprolyl isomerase n=1 Tax=Pseudooceanicola sp. HF7 TaxID=2721560 RepID=UPI0014309CF5|nr:peptidylprolyl isomerase [Pseudooceanicola sp. HF7]NIZ09865.1 peptidylprolyl isomerase [Pseudooceanicola sp. HF7]